MDLKLLLIVSLAFASAVAIVILIFQSYLTRAQLKRRLPNAPGIATPNATNSGASLQDFVAEYFTKERFGVEGAIHSKLRLQLMRAGFFRSDAVNYYIFSRLCTVCLLPICAFLLMRIFVPNTVFWLVMLTVSICAFIAILGPDAFLSWRQGQLEYEYRLIFPDMLDLLVVCVSAGLSVEAGFERVRGQLRKQSRALGLNLDVLAAEMRAGRSMVDALNSFSDRLALDEAASFVGVIRHSYELGGDVGNALRVFSDEMRDKRLLRAEETANKLTVKLVVPLALFIFPVILTIVMMPVFLKLMVVFSAIQ